MIRADVPNTGRKLIEILNVHNLSPQQFAGKTVLDLGCGFSNIAVELNELGITTYALGLDANSSQLKAASCNPLTTYVIADIGNFLPVANNSIDIVLGTYSLPMWSRTAKQLFMLSKETRRVTKKGSVLSFYPAMVASPQKDLISMSKKEVNATRRAMSHMITSFKLSPAWRSTLTNDDLFQAYRIR